MLPRGVVLPRRFQRDRRRLLRPPIASAIERRKASSGEGGHKVNLSCGSRLFKPSFTPPPVEARRCVPSTAIQAKHGPLSTLARRVITPDWERAEGRIRPLCYFSRSGLQSRSSRQTSSSSSLHTVVAPQPVYSHTPCGTSTFDP